ncbi:MAG: acyl-CoA dehydrogenase, partial [Pseudomonadota bacterium]
PSFLKPNDYPAPDHSMSVTPRRLNGLASTIFGGASEVQRDIIAKVVLS